MQFQKNKIIDAVLNYNIKLFKRSVVINITNKGYIKRGPLTSLKAQKEVEKEKPELQPEKKILLFKFLQPILTHDAFFNTRTSL